MRLLLDLNNDLVVTGTVFPTTHLLASLGFPSFPKAGFSNPRLTLSQTEVSPGGGCDDTHMVPHFAQMIQLCLLTIEYRFQVQSGDVLVAVNGRNVRGSSIQAVAQLILGPIGSSVPLPHPFQPHLHSCGFSTCVFSVNWCFDARVWPSVSLHPASDLCQNKKYDFFCKAGALKFW